MKKVFIAGLVVLTASISFAQPGPGQNQGMRMQLMDDMSLTDAQRSAIDKIHTKAMQEGIDRRAEIAKARVDLQSLLKVDNPDQSVIEKKMDEISALQSDARKHRIQTWFSINKQLNPEQRKIWKRGLERHTAMGRMKKGRGRMHLDGRGRDNDGRRDRRDRGPC